MARGVLTRGSMHNRNDDLSELRQDVEQINFQLLDLLSQRASLVTRIQEVKTREGVPTFVPEREREMIDRLEARNSGPFPGATIRHLFKEIFKASVKLMEAHRHGEMRVSRARHPGDLVIRLKGAELGGEAPALVAGPCAVEDEAQMEEVASGLARLGVRFMRGGAFKPRSSPYSFQGLGEQGLRLLQAAAQRHDLVTITEVMDPRAVELVAAHADILQIGARNMYNYDLLREVGRAGKPVLLKRALSATIDELLWSAEYILLEGNERVILCERGVRTFGKQTRNTLDISAVPLLRQQSFLPVMVDVSHAAGRRDILAPLGRAALAAGASGLMVEVHPEPALARSDSQQQLDLDAFARFMLDTGFLAELPASEPLAAEA